MNARIKTFALVLLSLSLLVFVAACNNQANGQQTRLSDNETSVIEPGVSGEEPTGETSSGEVNSDVTVPDNEPEEEFVDLGEATTVEDLIRAQQKITSYYFEQYVEYSEGEGQVFLQIWYKDGKMKLVSSVDGYALNENYYNYNEGTVISYSPGSGTSAIMMDFDEAAEDAPDNPVKNDYALCTEAGRETINRQYCMILDTPDGDRFWVGSKYGFPLQAEFTDSNGQRLTVQYKNVSINTLTDEDVEPPADLEVYYYGSNN